MGWLSRVANLWRGSRLDREIDEELQFHVDARTHDLVAAGLSADAASREARRRLGNRLSVRERVRDRNVVVQVERVLQDIRSAGRAFARDPALTAIAILSIAMGTGANVAIFSVADALLLRPLPVFRPNDVLAIGTPAPGANREELLASYADYVDVRDRARTLEGVMAYRYEFVGIGRSEQAEPHVRMASFVTDNYFGVLGVNLQFGRSFSRPEADREDPQPVVVLTDGLWRTEFHGDLDVIGKELRVGGVAFRIVGVAPPEFVGLHPIARESLFLPIGMLPRIVDVSRNDALEARDARILVVKGRVRPGQTIDEVRAELGGIARQLQMDHPDTNTNRDLVAETEFQYRYKGSRLISSMLVLTTILSAGVLCVACANVASLLASRAPTRAREMALRLAVGASRTRLIRQLTTESLCLAAAGGVSGLGVARIGITLLRGIQIPSEIVTAPPLQLDERALVFSLAIAVASVFLVGLAPALQATRVDLVTTLKAGDRGSRKEPYVGRAALVAFQIALALVLFTVAASTFRFVHGEIAGGPGFRTSHVAKLTVDAGQAHYRAQDAERFFTSLLEKARMLPSVTSVSLASDMPMFSLGFAPLVEEGRVLAAGESAPVARSNSVDDRYFDTMAIAVLEGRRFRANDDANAVPVAIVNDTLARHYWPNQRAIGRHLRVLDEQESLVEIVGVVKTSVYYFLGEVPEDAIYFPYQQRPRGQMVLLAQTFGESKGLLTPLRQVVADLDRTVPVFDVSTMEHFYEAGTTGTLRSVMGLIGGLGLMGLSLATIGLYGLVSYGVNRRTREFGIRIAIGATASRITTMVLRQGMEPAWIGLGVGLGLSIVVSRFLVALVPLRSVVDATIYAAVVPACFLVTIIAALVPARRAARVNPVVALRCE